MSGSADYERDARLTYREMAKVAEAERYANEHVESGRVRQGDTVRCSVPEAHATHLWVMPGFPHPLRCDGGIESECERPLVLLPRVLVKDARDLLWHNPGHLLGGVTDCPGCDLEAQLDAALNDRSERYDA